MTAQQATVSYDSQPVADERRDIRRIDPVDSEILRLLSADARMSYRALGAAVGLSANGAADRVRRLREAGVIEGFTTVLGVAATDPGLDALIDVRLAPDQDDDAFESAVARLPNVIGDVHLAGRTDHQLRVHCRDADELDACEAKGARVDSADEARARDRRRQRHRIGTLKGTSSGCQAKVCRWPR